MPLNFDSNNSDFITYLKLTLGGTVHRWGTRYITLDDGTAIDGLLVGMTPLVESTGSLLDPRLVFPSVVVDADNKPEQDGTRLQDLLDSNEFANASADILVGQGTDPASYQTIFQGLVKFPGGIFFNDQVLSLQLNHARAKDGRFLPTSKYDTTTFPNMDLNKVDKPRPIVYGDWRTTAEGALAVPCVQIDSTVGTGGRFEIAAHTIKEIEQVKKNGVSVAFSSVDLTNARFVLDVSFNAATDVITAHVQGATIDGTSSGTLIEQAPDLFKDLLVTRLGVSAGNVNSTALTDWAAALSSTDKMRRWIGGADVHSDDLLAQLLSEGFADLSIESGQYYPRYRLVILGSSLPQFMQEDLQLNESGDGRALEIEQFSEALYTNEVEGIYRYNPVTEVYLKRNIQEDTPAITTKGQRIRRTLTMNWLYTDQGVKDRVAREVFVFGEPELIDLGVTERGTTLLSASQFRLVYNKYKADGAGLGVPFQVRDMSKDPIALRTRIGGWNMERLATGTWTEDAAVTWDTATGEQRATKGFWSNDNGYADGAGNNEASRRYRWI